MSKHETGCSIEYTSKFEETYPRRANGQMHFNLDEITEIDFFLWFELVQCIFY